VAGKYAKFDAKIIELLREHGKLKYDQIRPLIKKAFPELCDDRDIDKWDDPRWEHNLRAHIEYMKKNGEIMQIEQGEPYYIS
jgi:hypothetical protein